MFGKGTGVAIQVCSPEFLVRGPAGLRRPGRRISIGSDKSRPLQGPTGVMQCLVLASDERAWAYSPTAGADSPSGRTWLTSAEQRISAEKRSAVSTGQLRRLLALHTRPIYPVVFREPSSHKGKGDLISQRVSRLDAFSVYPGRTLATQRCR